MITTTTQNLIPTVPVKSIMKTACVAQCQPKDFHPKGSQSKPAIPLLISPFRRKADCVGARPFVVIRGPCHGIS